jgi:hypothetical protein
MAGLTASLLDYLIVGRHAISIGDAIAVAIAIPGLCFPRLIELPYRVWNRAARRFAQIGTVAVAAVCYHGLFRLVRFWRLLAAARGRAGVALDSATRPGATGPRHHGDRTTATTMVGAVQSLGL